MQRDRAGTIEGRTELAHEVFEIFTHVDDELRRDEYLKFLAKQLGLDPWSTRSQFANFIRAQRRPVRVDDAVLVPKFARTFTREDVEFVALLLDEPGRRVEAKELVGDIVVGSDGPIERILAAIIAAGPAAVIARDVEEGAAQALLAAASNFDGVRTERTDTLFRERLDGLRRDHLRGLARRVQEQIEAAQRSGAEWQPLVREKIRIEQEIRRVGPKVSKPLIASQTG
jgi:hypothetical protein